MYDGDGIELCPECGHDVNDHDLRGDNACNPPCPCGRKTQPTRPRQCPHCHGKGRYTVTAGERVVVHDPCRNCGGTGTIHVPIRVRA